MLHHFLFREVQQKNQQCRIKAKGKTLLGNNTNKSSLFLLTSVIPQRRSKYILIAVAIIKNSLISIWGDHFYCQVHRWPAWTWLTLSVKYSDLFGWTLRLQSCKSWNHGMLWVEGDPKNSLTGSSNLCLFKEEDELKLLLQISLGKVWCWHVGNSVMLRCDSVNSFPRITLKEQCNVVHCSLRKRSKCSDFHFILECLQVPKALDT